VATDAASATGHEGGATAQVEERAGVQGNPPAGHDTPVQGPSPGF